MNQLCADETGQDAADLRCYSGTMAMKSFSGPSATCSQTGRTARDLIQSSFYL